MWANTTFVDRRQKKRRMIQGRKKEDERKICSHLLLLNFVDTWLKEEK